MRTASLHAIRANETDIAVAALPMYADLLAEQGYIHAALRWSQRGLELADDRGDSCDLAATLRTTGWIQLLLRQQGWSSIDPTLDLEEALAIYGPRGKCPSSSRTGGARLSLALLKLLAGEPAKARKILGKAKLSRMTPGERVLAIDVGLQAQLALGHPPARIDRALRRLRRAVEDADTTNAQWHLALRRGQVLEARGEHAAAIEAYREAETHVDGLAQLAAFGVGRSTIGMLHRESSDRLVHALLAQDQTSEALCVVRQTEARRLQAVSLPLTLSELERAELDALHQAQVALDTLLDDVRDAATIRAGEEANVKVSRQRRVLESMTEEVLRRIARHALTPRCEDLHEPAEGELLLGLFPNGGQWLLFARDSKGTQAHTVDLRELDYDLPDARARLSEILLRPVATQVERAQRIRVHAVGQAQHIDVDLLPWNGGPLVTSKSVAWGVDVAAAAWPVVTGAREARAVLLPDPSLSLPDAYAEILHAAGTLADTGVLVEVVEPADARRAGLLDQMDGATLLHFAGHADHDMLGDPGLWPPYAGGTPSWPASLLLADDERLGAHEILARPAQVPRKVILSACSTGALDASASGTSLAVAFVVAGAEEVLAATGRPNDAEARAVMQQLYDELAGTPLADWSLVDALAAVTRRRVEAGEAEVGYRVLVR
jgi:tetratricopeptide (TPR) repeat protein